MSSRMVRRRFSFSLVVSSSFCFFATVSDVHVRAPVDGIILGFSSSFSPLLISAREQVGQASAGRLQVKFSIVALGQLGNFSQHLSTGIYTDRVLRGWNGDIPITSLRAAALLWGRCIWGCWPRPLPV